MRVAAAPAPVCVCAHSPRGLVGTDRKWLRVEAGVPGPGDPHTQLSRGLQRQMCLPQVSSRAPSLPRSSKVLWSFTSRSSNRSVFSFRYLYGFEEYCTSTAITFRMDLPLKQSAKGEVKSEGDAGGAASSSSSEEQAALLDSGASKAPAGLCKVQEATTPAADSAPI